MKSKGDLLQLEEEPKFEVAQTDLIIGILDSHPTLGDVVITSGHVQVKT